MRQESLLILSALADQPRHGYAVIKKVTELSGGAKELRPGTLYAALGRFEDDGLVSVDREEVVNGRNRRYYRITERGSEKLLELAAQRAREVCAIGEQIRLAGLELT